jgi:flavin-dependent dehydrogenase
MSQTQFDVVIIGAGPAGVAAALPLLAAGRRVLVLERGPLEPAKLPETLLVSGSGSTTLTDVIRQAAVDAALPFDVCFIAANGAHKLRIEYIADHGAPSLVRIDRVQFDRLLRQAALDRGAVMRFNESATGVGVPDDPDQFVTVSHSGAAGPSSSGARLVIDASGKTCFLRTELRLEDAGHVLDNRGGWFTHLLVSEDRRRTLPATVNIVPFENGFLYGVWINPTRLSIGVTLFAPTTEPGELQYRRAIETIGWMSELLQGARQVLPVIPVQNREFQVQRLASPHYLVAGDAGGFRDPFYCNGIQTALETGERAGTAANDILASVVARRHEIATAYQDGYWSSVSAGDARLRTVLAGAFEPLRQCHLADPHVPYPISATLVALAANAAGGVDAQMASLRRAL